PVEFKPARIAVQGFSETSQSLRLVQHETKKGKVTFLLFGTRLSKIRIISPTPVPISDLKLATDPDMLRLVELTTEQTKSVKQLVLGRDGERPMLVAVPTETKPADPTPRERAVVGVDDVIVAGGLDGLSLVLFQSKSVPFELIEDGKAVRL